MGTDTKRELILSTLNPRTFELILFPTEQCNFRCTYCYEDFSIGKMKPSTVTGVKRLLDRRAPELDHLSLSWFGGEPLAARDVVLDIARHATRLADQNPALNYRGSMTTNGYFLHTQLLSDLVSAGVRNYQISLDGWQSDHDRTRRRADGSETFEKIWANLKAIRASDYAVRILIRVHLQPHAAGSIDALVSELRRQFGDDPRFDVFFKPVGNWGGPNSGKFSVLPGETGAQRAAELQAEWARRPGGGPRLDETADSPSVCYAARPNSLTVRADGSVGKCTVMLKDPRNRVGVLRPDGTLQLEADRLRPWLRGYRTLSDSELGCPAAGLPKSSSGLLQVGSA